MNKNEEIAELKKDKIELLNLSEDLRERLNIAKAENKTLKTMVKRYAKANERLSKQI